MVKISGIWGVYPRQKQLKSPVYDHDPILSGVYGEVHAAVTSDWKSLSPKDPEKNSKSGVLAPQKHKDPRSNWYLSGLTRFLQTPITRDSKLIAVPVGHVLTRWDLQPSNFRNSRLRKTDLCLTSCALIFRECLWELSVNHRKLYCSWKFY